MGSNDSGRIDALGPAERAYLDALCSRVAVRLGHALLAVYLFGSGASGDYVPGISDLDVQVVTSASTPLSLRRSLAADVSFRSLACPACKLELVVYPRAAVAAPRMPVAWELNVNTGAGSVEVVSFDPASESAHWFLLDLAMGRSIASTLLGPPPVSVVGAVPRAVQLEAIEMSLAWHAGAEPASANAVLNASRAWRYIDTSRWGSKSDGAEWLIETHPSFADAAAGALAGRVDASRSHP